MYNIKNYEYDSKYNDLISKYELELENKLKRDSFNYGGVSEWL